ncbi:MAG: LapA family protein [Alphaproteobacteria bacterium]|nr:LapA family protein [Alphaproteobacteria bacterium]
MAERRRSRTWTVLRWLIGLPVVAVAILFALDNRGTLALSFWPTGYGVSLPVFLAVFAAVLAGFVLGGMVAWMAGGRRRAEQREAERQAERLRRENDELRRRVDAAEAAAKPATATVEQAKRQLVVANS